MLAIIAACGSDAPFMAKPMWTVENVADCSYAYARSGDLNGDEYDDVLVVDPDCSFRGDRPARNSMLRIYLGTPSGIESKPVAEASIETSGIESLWLDAAVFDADGDGRFDIYLSWLAGAGIFRFTEDASERFRSYVPAPSGIDFITDLDGDGAHEVFVGMQLYHWDVATGGFADPVVVDGWSVSGVGDLDGDGMRDIVVYDSGYALRRGCRDRCPDPYLGSPIPIDLPGQPWAALDANDDGRPDVALFSSGSRVQVHATDEQGLPRADPLWSLVADPADAYLSLPRFTADIDGDGASDAIVKSGRRHLLFRGSSDGPERLPSWEWRLPNGWRTLMPSRDFDGDGSDDVMFFEVIDGISRFAAYRGGAVPAEPRPEYPDGYAACELHAGELPDLGIDADAIRRSVSVRDGYFDASSCEVAEQCVGGVGKRRLLQFSASVQNFGGAPAELPGPTVAPDLFRYDSCHEHDHLVGFASYELLDAQGDVVVAGHKQGYYLLDTVAYCDVERVEHPGGDVLWISPGWSDVYPAGLACQWVDITDVQDGDYQLRVRVNDNDVFEEDDLVPNEAVVSVQIRGGVATAD
jgi:hypothetical protein